MKSATNFSYNDWYILQVKTNKEYTIKNIVENLCCDQYKLLIFSREILHTNKGRTIKITTPLFPGYIFLYREIYGVLHILQRNCINEFVQPVCFNGMPATVTAEEMRLLFSSSDDQGLIRLSQAYLTEDGGVRIVEGPLKDIEGKIVFINKKKHKVKVRLTLFNREINANLGLDFIRSENLPSPMSLFTN